ncbi:MAG: hypothetical protein QGH94_09695 [Phycisphaerae bacterium]|jgi:hypothetical protein|nr:hypothetical protein [Phycisphaerae bacterium]
MTDRTDKNTVSRRTVLKAPLAATVGAAILAGAQDIQGAKPPRPQAGDNSMSYGMIGDRKVSRLILGANTPGCHSRDLIYTSQLGRAYHTKERMLKIYELAESQGINTLLQGNTRLIREHNAKRGGKLRIIKPVSVTKDGNKEQIKKTLTTAMRNDMAALFYIWGDRGDYLARAKRMDLVGTAMEIAKSLGITLGFAGHSLQVVIECEKNSITPDFYVKTFHHDNYWSATPKANREPFCWYDSKGGNSYSGKTGDHDRFHDNIWCLDAEKTIDVMQKVKVPWIAFKVLAAGAISPTSGFKFAFNGGADFVAVGMCDFHIKPNVQVLKGLFARGIDRKRPWP